MKTIKRFIVYSINNVEKWKLKPNHLALSATHQHATIQDNESSNLFHR